MTQTLNGQDIGQAHYATRALLERALTDAGIDFPQSVTLNLLGGNDSPMTSEDLRARLVHGLKITEDDARAVEAGVRARSLVVGAEAGLVLTPAGSALFHQVAASIAEITEILYGGLPTEELITARRVLSTITARANAALVG